MWQKIWAGPSTPLIWTKPKKEQFFSGERQWVSDKVRQCLGLKENILTATLVHHPTLVSLRNSPSPNTPRLHHGGTSGPPREVPLATFPRQKCTTRVVALSAWTTAAQHRVVALAIKLRFCLCIRISAWKSRGGGEEEQPGKVHLAGTRRPRGVALSTMAACPSWHLQGHQLWRILLPSRSFKFYNRVQKVRR